MVGEDQRQAADQEYQQLELEPHDGACRSLDQWPQPKTFHKGEYQIERRAQRPPEE